MPTRLRKVAPIALTLALASLAWAMNQPDASLIIAGILLLVLGADWLVAGASALARDLGVSPLVIGLTVVAFGTSAPELAASVRATLAGEGSIAIGNVVGSNIANVCLILGLTALFRPIPVESAIVRRDVPIMIAVTIAGIAVMLGGTVSRPEGTLLTLGIIVFTAYLFIAGKRESILAAAEAGEPQVVSLDQSPRRSLILLKTLVGLGGLVLGSDLLVDGATGLATRMGVSPAVIGLSIVAFGTSVPELTTSLTAAFKRESDIAVGNILGSNVFNILCVLGISSLVRPIAVPGEAVSRDMWVMLVVAIACLPILSSFRRITRIEGGILVVSYFAYMAAIYVL